MNTIGSVKATTRPSPINAPPPGPSTPARRGKLEIKKVWVRLPTNPVANGECKTISMGRTTGWSKRPHQIQYILSMIGVSAEYYRKIGNNEISANRRNCDDSMSGDQCLV